MSVIYSINRNQKVVLTNVEGVVDGSQIISHQSRLRTDPNFKPNMNELMNCMALEDIKLTTIKLSDFVADSPWGTMAKRAVVVPNPRVFGLLRFFQALMSNEHGEIFIFNNVQSAREWLGI